MMNVRRLATGISLLNLAFLFTASAGCGDDTSAGGDTGGGGSTDGGFAPDATYPGEGMSCRFSIECPAAQLCVDDTCVRHERLSADGLELTELRVLNPGLIEDSPLYRRAPVAWDQLVPEVGDTWLMNMTAPGPGTSQMLFFIQPFSGGAMPDTCQVAVLGDELRVLAVEHMTCHAATTDEEGRVAIAGSDTELDRLSVALFSAAGEEVYRTSLPSEIETTIRDTHGEDTVLTHVTSLLLRRGSVHASARLAKASEAFGTVPPDEGPLTSFLRVDAEGEWETVSVGGAVTARGSRGWLVQGDAGVMAILTTPLDDIEAGTTRVIRVSSGATEWMSDALGSDARYQQHAPVDWTLSVGHRCTWYVLDDSLELAERRMLSVADCPGDNTGGWYPNPSGAAKPVAPMLLHHSTISAVRYAEGRTLELTDAEDQVRAHLDIEELDLGRSPGRQGFGFLSRYGLSVEGNYGLWTTGAPFVWIEYALSRRGE